MYDSRTRIKPPTILLVGCLVLLFVLRIVIFRPSKQTQPIIIDSKPETYYQQPNNINTLSDTSNLTKSPMTFSQSEGVITLPSSNVSMYVTNLKPDNEQTQTQVIFLHGASFTSQVWLDQNIAQRMAQAGNEVVLVDLPGYGKSQQQNQDKAMVIGDILNLNPEKINILVSPSMSGQFAIPFLEKHYNKVACWVPVAAVGASTWHGLPNNQASQLRVHAVHGELDQSRIKSSTHLIDIFPNSQLTIIPKAPHPAYIRTDDAPNSPDQFVDILLHEIQEAQSRANLQD